MKFSEAKQISSPNDLSEYLRERVLYHPDTDHIADRAARLCGVSRRAMYGVLYGEIKPKPFHLHAFVIASGGDPMVRSILEPEGYVLVPEVTDAPTDNIDHEIGDIFAAAADLQAKIRTMLADGKLSESECRQLVKAADNCKRQIDEVIALAKKRM